MKKVLFVFALLISASIVVSSCKGEKEEKHEENSEMHEEHAADQADIAMAAEYQCPMDCEEGKTYDSEGSCPVCEMSLKKIEKEGKHVDGDSTSHEDHEEEHEENHDSNEGH